MEKPTKDFDCVKMKDRIQQEIRADYEAHKQEFKSYAEFLEARIKEDPWASAMMAELCGSRTRD